ncbi:acyl carrier protein [Saccharothrix sp. BKS2]|uniref:Acyl carrier protein n=1 Tax=Saccharothrix lopnurensis TaxID=1670621 RepID=A0ABW1PE02_9PSEU
MWDQDFEDLVVRHLPFLGAGERLEPDSGLRDYGLDSMAVIELLTEVETAYDIRFEGAHLAVETFETPGRLWEAITLSRARG